MKTIDEVLQEISQQIVWDNWVSEEPKDDEPLPYLLVTEVLSIRLMHLLEDVKGVNPEEDDWHAETVRMTQELLAVIKSESN